MSRRRNKKANKRKPHGAEAGAKGSLGRGGFRPGAGRPRKPEPELPPGDEAKPTPAVDEVLAEPAVISRSDSKMIERAVKHKWPIKNSLRRAIVEKMEAAVNEGCPKTQIAAARVIIAADKLNIHRETAAESKENSGTNINVNITVEAAQQQAELAAIAEEIRARRVVEAVHVRPAGIGHSADGGASETGSQGSDGDG